MDGNTLGALILAAVSTICFLVALVAFRQVARYSERCEAKLEYIYIHMSGQKHWLTHEFPDAAAVLDALERVIDGKEGFDIATFREQLRSKRQ